MKKIAITIILLVITTQWVTAQKSVFDRKHEAKLGVIKLLAGPIIEGTYEYIYTKDLTFGSSVTVNVDNNGNDWFEDFSLTPFARFYFQESKEYGASGFFAEGFLKYFSGNEQVTIDEISVVKDYSNVSLGVSVGKKWFNSSGFIFEVLVGVGRTLGGADIAPEATFRGDINIGYRF